MRASEMPSESTMSRIVDTYAFASSGASVLGAVDRLRDDLDERHAGAVVVDERVLGALDAAGRAADVGELAGVLLHVRALDRHRERRVPSASSTSTEPSNAIGSSYCEIW